MNAVIRIRAGDAVVYGICPPARAECAACARARIARTEGMEGPNGKMHAFVLRAHTIMKLGQAGYSSVGKASDYRMRSHQMVPGSIPGGWNVIASAVDAYASAADVVRIPEGGGKGRHKCNETNAWNIRR